jgi:hypothetical protein
MKKGGSVSSSTTPTRLLADAVDAPEGAAPVVELAYVPDQRGYVVAAALNRDDDVQHERRKGATQFDGVGAGIPANGVITNPNPSRDPAHPHEHFGDQVGPDGKPIEGAGSGQGGGDETFLDKLKRKFADDYANDREALSTFMSQHPDAFSEYEHEGLYDAEWLLEVEKDFDLGDAEKEKLKKLKERMATSRHAFESVDDPGNLSDLGKSVERLSKEQAMGMVEKWADENFQNEWIRDAITKTAEHVWESGASEVHRRFDGAADDEERKHDNPPPGDREGLDRPGAGGQAGASGHKGFATQPVAAGGASGERIVSQDGDSLSFKSDPHVRELRPFLPMAPGEVFMDNMDDKQEKSLNLALFDNIIRDPATGDANQNPIQYSNVLMDSIRFNGNNVALPRKFPGGSLNIGALPSETERVLPPAAVLEHIAATLRSSKAKRKRTTQIDEQARKRLFAAGRGMHMMRRDSAWVNNNGAARSAYVSPHAHNTMPIEKQEWAHQTQTDGMVPLQPWIEPAQALAIDKQIGSKPVHSRPTHPKARSAPTFLPPALDGRAWGNNWI